MILLMAGRKGKIPYVEAKRVYNTDLHKLITPTARDIRDAEIDLSRKYVFFGEKVLEYEERWNEIKSSYKRVVIQRIIVDAIGEVLRS